MSEHATHKTFFEVDYIRNIKAKGFWGTDTEFVDREAYCEAIHDFLTILGSARVISLQSCWSVGFHLGFTEVWYWETE
jgi:hypothetical protein